MRTIIELRGSDLLEELLVVSLLEGMAQYRGLARDIKKNLCPKALDFLLGVERDYYGR